MMNQWAGDEGGVPPSEVVVLPVEVTLMDGVTTKEPERKCARGGCDAACCSPEGIAARATTLTPLLAEILTHKSTPTLEMSSEPGLSE